jgi:hypothetical protein
MLLLVRPSTLRWMVTTKADAVVGNVNVEVVRMHMHTTAKMTILNTALSSIRCIVDVVGARDV